MSDLIGGRTPDEMRDELIAQEWSTRGVPPECAACGAPIQWTGRGFLHVAPAMPLAHDPDADPRYASESIQAGIDLYAWIERTSTHVARIDP